MELESIKYKWQSKKVIGYSQEELNSIYDIKKANILNQIKTGFSLDLTISMFLTVIFIVILQVLAFESSNFWSACMVILAVQHYVFYKIQGRMIRKFQSFEQDVATSIDKTIDRLKTLLWFYRAWPALLSVFLYNFYIMIFTPALSNLNLLIIGAFITVGTAILSNYISAVMIRRHIDRLISIKNEFQNNKF